MEIPVLGVGDGGNEAGMGALYEPLAQRIMDFYNVFFESVTGNPKEERDTITKMTIALWNHTDGRETKHFLNKWFDKLLETDSKPFRRF